MLEKASGTSISEVESIKQFFKKGALLTRACNEIGLEPQAVRRNLNGKPGDIKLMFAVILGEWVRMWKQQEEQRKALADQVES